MPKKVKKSKKIKKKPKKQKIKKVSKKIKKIKKAKKFNVKVVKEKLVPFEPIISEMENQYMVVVTTPPGQPTDTLPKVIPALYGTMMGIKMSYPKSQRGGFGGFEIYGRWPNAHLVPKDEWVSELGLKVDKTAEEFFNTHKDVREKILKKREENAPCVEVRFEKWDYGTVGIILHIGSFSEEGPTVKRLHNHIVNSGYVFNGVHEEVYLSDPRRTKEESLKTVILYPIRKGTDDEVVKFKKELEEHQINF
ncbi:MAG: GyrI-like domain-containing protein [Candidatus Helarchaeota archaeon]|nr:GyrI-like domain-containing protein [Candidatus Helarchaeota archaeon]